MKIKANNANSPIWKDVYSHSKLPQQLEPLNEIATNLWWVWNHEGAKLFGKIDKQLWKSTEGNPVQLLQSLSHKRMEEILADKELMAEIQKVYADFKAYINVKPDKTQPSVAYFSMEYGLTNVLKIYSGGLGVLAGDYLKEASDSNIDLCAVGFLYRYGYFTQTLSMDGQQIANYEPQNFNALPLTQVLQSNGEPMVLEVPYPGRTVYVHIWKVSVGRVPLYLMDTDIPQNSEWDRSITHQLYGGDWENRMKQEYLLGIGGIMMLNKLGIKKQIYHCNEGHAALINAQRLVDYIQNDGLSFNQALEVVRASALYTVHTPVPAGHDYFDEGLFGRYMGEFPGKLGISWQDFIDMGRENPGSNEKFSMSVFALNTCQEANGVSWLHGKVSQRMFAPVWKGYFPDELHVGYVTNGVHMPTWAATEVKKFYADKLGTKLNTGMEDMSEKNQYILSYLPVVKQKTYTLGAVYKHYAGKNLYSVIISRSQTNNKNIKYKDNDESKEENLSLNYRSDEIENKFRTENTFRLPFIQLNVGGNIEYAQYTNDTYQKQFTSIPRTIVYQTDLGIWKWGIYATAIYESYNERFTASLGVRADANNYSSDMNNLLDQLSPRLSLSYRLSDPLYINANIGRYYELPPYTTLGFKDNEGNYVNRTNHLSYIRSDQAGLGLEYRPTSYLKFTAEGFYKHYDRYPMSILDSIPLASKGTDYGVLGNEAVSSTATGRAYGLEIMGRWYNYKGLTFIASYTLVRSEFKDGRNMDTYLPSAWDNKHLFTFSGTYSLPKNWDVGAKFRVVGGAPYTPYDVEKSSYVEAWDANNGLYYDYSRFNSERLKPFTQLDIRIDKTFYFKKIMLGAYIDIQNILNSKYKEQDVYIKTGKIINPEAPIYEQRYELRPIERLTGTLLPSIGVMIEL